MLCISLAILSRLSQFPSLAVEKKIQCSDLRSLVALDDHVAWHTASEFCATSIERKFRAAGRCSSPTVTSQLLERPSWRRRDWWADGCAWELSCGSCIRERYLLRDDRVTSSSFTGTVELNANLDSSHVDPSEFRTELLQSCLGWVVSRSQGNSVKYCWHNATQHQTVKRREGARRHKAAFRQHTGEDERDVLQRRL